MQTIRIRVRPQRANPPGKIGRGSAVICNGQAFWDSAGNGAAKSLVNQHCTIALISPDADYCYQVNDADNNVVGWVSRLAVILL